MVGFSMLNNNEIITKFDDFISAAIDGGLVVNGETHKKMAEIREHLLIQQIDGDYPKVIRILYKMGRQLQGYMSIAGGIYLACKGIPISTELALLMSGPSALYIWAKGKGIGNTST